MTLLMGAAAMTSTMRAAAMTSTMRAAEMTSSMGAAAKTRAVRPHYLDQPQSSLEEAPWLSQE